MTLARAVLSLCLVVTGQVMDASGSAAEIPICAQSIDPSTFTPKGTNLVRGAPHERLYLHSQHPDACAGTPGTSCPATTYIVTGDSVSTGQICGDWTAVKYLGKKRDFYGWVESNRLVETMNAGVLKKAPIATSLADASPEGQSSATNSIKRSELSFDGIGKIKIHGKFDPIAKWLHRQGSHVNVQRQAHADEADVETMECADVAFYVGADYLGAQFRGGQIERVDVLGSETKTTAGIHMGSTEKQVRDAYAGHLLEFEGDLDNSANISISYEKTAGHAFIVKSPNYDRDQLALLIETDGTEVVGLHAGTKWAFGKYDHAVEATSCLTWGEEDTPHAFDSTPRE